MWVKDRWVGTCEQVLNVLITYWCYGPSKPSSPPSTSVWLFPIASLAVMEEKLGTDPWIGQPSCHGSGREPLLSGEVDSFNSVDDCVKGCYAWTAWDTYGRGPYADWAQDVCGVLIRFLLQGVHRFESPWLSNMSNRLSCGCQHVDD
jgi:hypothetical protein